MDSDSTCKIPGRASIGGIGNGERKVQMDSID